MKKRLIIVSLIVALAAPAVALASIRDFSGDIDPTGHIQFSAKINDATGQAVKVRRGLRFRGVRIRCDSGRTKIHGKFHTAIPVVKRQFSATGTYAGGGQVTVDGTFTHHARRAFGTIKVTGDFTLPDPDLTNCHGTHDWHARKV